MHMYPHLAAKLYNTPLMIAESKFTVIEGVFRAWESGHAPMPDEKLIAEFAERQTRMTLASAIGPQRRYADKPYQMTDSGIAVIPVMGSLVQRASGLDAMSGLTSYGSLDSLFSQAYADPDVRGILEWYDTPGGEVAGLFALSAKLMAERGGKPTLAYIDEQALSAGYLLASTADEIWMPSTGLAGSIGSIFMHREQSARNAAQGYVYTLIRSGAHKAAGNPHEPLDGEALAWFQAEADRLRLMFADHVDGARGVEPGSALATEARVFSGPSAIEHGLANSIGSLAEAIAHLESSITARGISGSAPSNAFNPAASATNPANSKEPHMSDPNKTDNLTAEQLAAVKSTAHAEGLKAGALAERTRIGAILNATEAQGRAKLAQTFALESDLDAATVQKLLAASPTEAAAASANPLAAAMAGVKNPDVGPDGGDDKDKSPQAEASALALQIINAGKPAKRA